MPATPLDSPIEEVVNTCALKIEALQYIIEVVLANQFGARGAGAAVECEQFGKFIANHARSAVPTLPPGSGPIDLDSERTRTWRVAVADEIEHIVMNAAERIRSDHRRKR
jgi:hypothetical protein